MNFEKLIIDRFKSSVNEICLPTEFQRIIKSIKHSKDIRMIGNKMFTECKHNHIMHQRIWESYLCSIALAPNGSEDLAISYGNMSALMYHISKFQECIGNIEEALKVTASIPLKIKLLCRKSKCLSAMGMPGKENIFEEAKSWLDKIDDSDESKDDLVQVVNKTKIVLDKNKVKVDRSKNDEYLKALNELPIVKKKKGKKRIKNSDFEHITILAQKEREKLFKSIVITHNDTYGSHLTATRDIQAGEIIFVIKPYVAVQNISKSQNFCNNCLNVIWIGRPCQNCACCMYCSEECQNEAIEKYHGIECPVIQFLLSGNSWLDYYIQASLRSVIMGVKEFGSIGNLRDQINKIDNSTDTAEDFDDLNYNSFLKLLGFKNIYVESNVLSELALTCCKTVVCLSKCTPFFENACKLETVEDFIENENIIFIAALLLRVAAIAFNNGTKVTEYGLFCKNYIDSTKCNSLVPCCEKGISINTLSQFVPHSCDPTVKSIKISKYKEMYYALQPIYKGDPLLECYKSAFFECEFSERHEEISRLINHNCTCQACEEQWPALLINEDRLLSIEHIMKIVLDSREHVNQKVRLFNLINEYGVSHQDIVDELSKISEINFNYFGQPSIEYCATIYALRFVFDELYAMKLNMPNACKTGFI